MKANEIMLPIKHFSTLDPAFENFVRTSPQGSVSQSFFWGKLQENVPSRGRFWAFAALENEQIVGTCVLIRHRLGRDKCYLYAHRGPVCEPNRPDIFQALLQECKQIAASEHATFLRLDPAWFFDDFDKENKARAFQKFSTFFAENGFQPAHAQYQPLSTLQLDLTKNLPELRSELRSMGKRNLKKAEKSDLEIRSTTDPQSSDLEIFDKLNQITTQRDGFYAHEIGYYSRILQFLGEPGIAHLYTVSSSGQPLAAALSTFYGQEAIYYYGASSNDSREKMAPFLLQWQMISDAQDRGCTRYDFLGIAPEPFETAKGEWAVWLGNELKTFSNQEKAQKYCDQEHSFAKITFFKTRFGGQRRDFVGAWEMIFDHKAFKMLLFLKKARKLARRLGLKI